MAISNKSMENLQNQAMTDEIRDNIMLLYQKGLDTGQVAQVTGVGRSSANSVRLAFERVAQKDYVGIRGNAGLEILSWIKSFTKPKGNQIK